MNISIIYAFMYACQIDFMKYLLQCYNVHCKKKKVFFNLFFRIFLSFLNFLLYKLKTTSWEN